MGFAMILINGNTALTCFWSTKLNKAYHFKMNFTENRTLVKLTKLVTIKIYMWKVHRQIDRRIDVQKKSDFHF